MCKLCGRARPVNVHLRGAGTAKKTSLTDTTKHTLVEMRRLLRQSAEPIFPSEDE